MDGVDTIGIMGVMGDTFRISTRCAMQGFTSQPPLHRKAAGDELVGGRVKTALEIFLLADRRDDDSPRSTIDLKPHRRQYI